MFRVGSFRHGVDREALSAANRASARARKAETNSEFLEREVDRLYLIVEALWEFIRDKNGWVDEDLELKIQGIDQRDGKLDGKATRDKPKNCSECGRALSRTKPFCIYCGNPVTGTTFER